MKHLAGLFLLFLAAGALTGGSARAQSASHLIPDRYELAAGGEVAIHLDRGGRVAWPSDEVEWLFIRSAGGQRNLAEARPRLPTEDFVRLALVEADVAMIGIDRRPWIEEVPGERLRRFLEAEVAPSALPEGWIQRTSRAIVRIRRLESAKLLVRSLGNASERPASATAASKAGLRSEIRAMIDPTAITVGSDLPVRLSWADSQAVDATIVARQPASATRKTSLARGGAGWFTVSAPGVWLVEVHRAKPLVGDPAADWELETATLNFEVRPAGGGK